MDTPIFVPNIPDRTKIPFRAIKNVADLIVNSFHPRKIILFGSYAYGTPKPESDVDLLVVMDTTLSPLKQAALISREIPYHFGIDLIVYTPARLAQRLEWGDPFIKEIVQRGKILYEDPHA